MKGELDESSSTLEQVVLTKNGNLRMPPRSELHTHIYLIIFLLTQNESTNRQDSYLHFVRGFLSLRHLDLNLFQLAHHCGWKW
jgi:hypothetical protein